MMEKNYEPLQFENRIYQWWEKAGYFTPEIDVTKKPFTILMPPPNITGQLHMGHALDNAVQDCIIRFKRMQGFATLWVPGTDHASIATEVKVAEKLAEKGIDKHQLGREGFLKEAWAWKEQYNNRILTQLKRLGVSCDWSRLAFTMDDNLSKAVKSVFVKMYKEGLIYQGDRITNWCPTCRTAISDAEVEFEEQAGNLWHFKYYTVDKTQSLTFATTRPETMFGDTAVAVNPSDERYADMVGKKLLLPFVNREIPIIADEYVEKDFGTGVVKITPAHDPNDFEVGLRHNLPVINVMDAEGKMNERAGEEFNGLPAKEARKKVVEKMKELGQLVKIEPYKHNVGQCYRCKTTVEPIVSKQWFVKMEPLAKPAIQAVKNDETKFVPKRFEKIYFNWMENIRDWCISRQLWWGHRIPVWYCDKCGEVICEEETPKVCTKCGYAHLRQDEDVLDTWFSSALWPFSTLGYPNKTKDLDYFFPTNVLVTAYDIIFFWVSRMIFSSIKHMGEVPFKDVLIHGIVRDEQGRKMSKSLGNGVDPLEVIDRVGADTLRFSLLNGVASGGDIRYSEPKVIANRNFMNKLWNASRFVLMNVENKQILPIEKCDLSLADKWILSKLNDCIKEVTKNFEKYELGNSCAALYSFVWSEFCDWYIEFSKPMLVGGTDQQKDTTASVLVYVLDKILKLMHPITPFITEEIYQSLPIHQESIMIESFPQANDEFDFAMERNVIDGVVDLVSKIRNARAEMNVAPSKLVNLFIKPQQDFADIVSAIAYIEKLVNAKVVFVDNFNEEKQVVSIVANCAEAQIPMGDLIDFDKEKERIKKELATTEQEIARANGKLNNQGFVAKAPPQLIEAEKQKLVSYEEIKQKLLER
ncbi:MAG: valine--tRNA ligase [Clostridia bacterium]|nr:valine--tRNA ligase [Clostridia bacterium]